METLRVEHISKQYRLGKIGTGSLMHDLNRWMQRIRGKEDPYLKIGDENDRTVAGGEYVWSLRDVNFSLNKGEVLGIIGKNGAGKSTLLKIISQVTSPTSGTIKAKGRIASLLEVGTGFHPDLTGRENVFLNGAILGMTKAEIKRNFDQIVDFSGVAKYIDTPVKRYSSGMYVRLAFAVAAHLESELLIVDEVLAVGDAEFQKKCMGKMKDVSGQGRTILFVSHNMSAINSLCTRCIYLKNGQLIMDGQTEAVVNKYLSNENAAKTNVDFSTENLGDDIAKLLSARLVNSNLETIEYCLLDQKIGIEFNYQILKEGFLPIPNIHIRTAKNEYAFVSSEKDSVHSQKGVYKTVMWIPAHFLNEGTYIADIALSTMDPLIGHFYVMDGIIFEVIEDINKRENEYRQIIPGVIRPQLNWNTKKIS